MRNRLGLFLLLLPLMVHAESPLIPPYYALETQEQTLPEQTLDQPTLTAEKNYTQLRETLSLYQNAATYPWPLIPDDARFRVGKKSPYVLLLRQHLHLLGDLSYYENNSRYDEMLLQAIKQFQSRSGLESDGVIGKNTRAALNISPAERVRQIEINIQRWEALSHKLGHRYVMVNVPDYHLYLVEDDKLVLSMKTIVGRPSRPTPEVFSRITRLVFKPYWNVPEKIAKKDIITKAMEDPDYLDKNNIHVYHDETHRDELTNTDIDWQSDSLHFRQDPGENNSLGLVKFEFPNEYSVYLHDTPAKNLFSEDKRDLSSGCIRLEKPFELVNYLMKDNPKWSDERRDELLSEEKPSYVTITQPIPVVITYITAWIDEKGLVNFRDDIYGKDNPDQKNLAAEEEN